MNLAVIDNIRIEANNKLDPANKSSLGQFMTPASIAQFMANLLSNDDKDIDLLDCGAGIGTLTIAASKQLKKINSIQQWEIDPIMRNYLEDNIKALDIPFIIHGNDFIEDAVKNIAEGSGKRFSHAILNPPYKKINSNSTHRKLLRTVGIETVNLYTAFLALTILLMKDGGQIVAIIPRSFCNGTYYKPFREFMLKHCGIEHIHLFDSRVSAFKDDDVLQENIIIKLVKSKSFLKTSVTTSSKDNFDNITQLEFNQDEIVSSNDPEKFIHIPTNKLQYHNSKLFVHLLSELGLQVSTGPVVDFRMRQYLLNEPTDDSIPIPYPHHFVNGEVEYPKEHKKYPNAMIFDERISKSFWTAGYYVLIKRFSSKEERRRVVAHFVSPDAFKSDLIAFENGWNVIHVAKKGIDADLASGLTCFLNSSEVDNFFRVFSGHTQVNATDLRNMKFPSLENLKDMGQKYWPGNSQDTIDNLIEGYK